MVRPNSNKYLSQGENSILMLKSGSSVLVDSEDVPLLSRYSWFDNGNGYIASKGKEGKIFLHRLVMGAPSDTVVDHINFDPMDNRKSNLRICTQQQNTLYQRSRKKHKGVYLNKRTGKYYIHVRIDGKTVHGGTFESIDEAVDEYQRLARLHYGKFAYIT
ncbi:HNH endonuclease [Enterococcus thailandicus]|nr:HNH endonuclease [Enterococcus thailandicus]